MSSMICFAPERSDLPAILFRYGSIRGNKTIYARNTGYYGIRICISPTETRVHVDKFISCLQDELARNTRGIHAS